MALDEEGAASRGPAWLHRAIRFAIDSTANRVWMRYAAAALVLVIVVGVSIAIIVNIQNIDEDDPSSALLAYIGLAFVSFTCCAVPIPGIAPILYGLVIYCGFALNPFVVAVVGGLAMALGEGVSYLLGALGLKVVESQTDAPTNDPKPQGRIRRVIGQLSGRVDEWMDKRGFITLLVLAAVPNPIVAFANISAGASGMPFAKFYAAVAIGKTIRSLVLAGIGVWLRTIV